MDNDSVKKTFVVALCLCLVCAVVVSASAIMLRPAQAFNKALDLKANILQSAGLYQPGVSIEKQFERISVRLVDLRTGQFSNDVDVDTYDQRKASKDPTMSVALKPDSDPAKLRRRPHYASVYLVEGKNGIEKLVLPVRGYGLWSTLYGFLALEGDLETVAGIGFYEHAETPGLGGEVDNFAWKASWIGKRAFEGNERVITVIKGKVDRQRPEAAYQIDGLAGATITTRGIDNLVKYWLGESGFAPFIRNLQIRNA
ncbi:MAG: Na(+)-translocating NADH-quinone reductase subunit C [Cellvibrionales bacterium TMED49]|nr:Na(+)-translocating NADH-quinone reductase subunit C [Porticoccaceae bacterium]OUU37700.1 MAG: Na(+)-translocating NADH-quinone reductase subunit C [Cellvibrionales bacterium TMED49]